MRIPYQCLQVCGDVLVAARGGKIHTFNLQSGTHSSTWEHASSKKQPDSKESKPKSVEETVVTPSPSRGNDSEQQADQDVPVKRIKLEHVADEDEQAQDVGNDQNGTNTKKPKKSKKGRPLAKQDAPGIPRVTALQTTADGRYIVAVTGADKTIWVFEHDGAGGLKQLSERIMPKRPSSIAITTDSKTIISADRFGDVYSLPLLPSSTYIPPTTTPTSLRLQADSTTVHTQRNRRALLAQQTTNPNSAPQPPPADAPPPFEHALLLGHVSMLTAVALASHAGKPYIVTADRDEHIRVSRAPPQSLVIEAFCLGHAEFVSALCVVPSAAGEGAQLLVSGGGDDALFVWDWRAGRLLSRAPLLELVRGVTVRARKVAVRDIRACGRRGGGTDVVVACDRVPALFCFSLSTENVLKHVQTVVLKGCPLDVAVRANDGASPELVVAVDCRTPQDVASDTQEGDADAYFLVLRREVGTDAWMPFALNLESPVAGLEDEAEISVEALHKLIYTAETMLRKYRDEQDDVA